MVGPLFFGVHGYRLLEPSQVRLVREVWGKSKTGTELRADFPRFQYDVKALNKKLTELDWRVKNIGPHQSHAIYALVEKLR